MPNFSQAFSQVASAVSRWTGRPLTFLTCIAIATESEVVSRRSRVVGGRDWVRLGAVEMGLDCLRRYLQGLPVHERSDFERDAGKGAGR